MKVLNSNYKIVSKDNISGQVLLKNAVTDSLLSLSIEEYDIIDTYSKLQSVDRLISHFSEQFTLTSNVVYQLIGIAEGYKLLIEPSEQELYPHEWRYFTILRYLFSSLLQRLGVPGNRVKLEFNGNFRLYKLISIFLDKTPVQKYFEDRKFLITYFESFLLLTVLLLGMLLVYQPEFIDIKHVLYTTSSQLLLGVIPLLLVLIVLNNILHELAHYAVYKWFGGKTNEFGIALLCGFLPIFYTGTHSIHFWNERSKRLLTASAGIISDIFFFLVYFTISLFHLSEVSDILSLYMLIYLGIATATNLNFFIPGTDGYYVFSDLFRLENVFYTVSKRLKDLLTTGFKGFAPRDILYSLYFILSMASITLYWLLITSPLWLTGYFLVF